MASSEASLDEDDMTYLLADIAAAVDTAVTAEQAALEALEAAVT